MNIEVRPVHDSECSCDFALACVGYESRARHFFASGTVKAQTKTALVFKEQQELDFEKNRQFFREAGFSEMDASVDGVKHWIEAIRASLGRNPLRQASVVVDISSMTRLMLSSICYELSLVAKQCGDPVSARFVYSPAEFGELPELAGPILEDGPVLSVLGGWPTKPGAPCGLVIGIGYEEDLALGVMEELEAAAVWAFRPQDHDKRYDDAINERNHGIFDEVPASNWVRYSVFDPFALYVSIESLIALSKRDFRIIIVPFGPKLFALASCIAVLAHYPEVGLWRVSAGANLRPVDRKPLGPTLALDVTFGPASPIVPEVPIEMELALRIAQRLEGSQAAPPAV